MGGIVMLTYPHTMDASDVNRLLERSQSAHAAYRVAANPASGTPNYLVAEQHVASAHDLLLQAHAADPEHRASGWAGLKAPYARFVAFYQNYPLLP